MKVKFRKAAVLFLAVIAAATNARDEASHKAVSFQITATSMVQALMQFTEQSGLQLMLKMGGADNIPAPPVVGEFTPTAALDRLLAGSGLKYQFANDRTIAIVGDNDQSISSAGSLTEGMRLAQDAASSDDTQSHSANTAQQSNSQRMQQSEEPSRESSDPSGRRIEEVVVTAQKREERLQDVPIAISVLGGDELDRSTTQGLTQILNTLPGVSATSSGILGGTMLVVRGVNGGLLFSGSNTVGYYLDAVPFGFVRNGIVPDVDVYDLERVEVLRGPQGTLYGANSQNGVVRILTHQADVEKMELKGRASVSSTKEGGENYRGDMAINVPIIEDKLAARAVLGYQDLSGWIDSPRRKDLNDGELKNARLTVNANPTEQLSIGLSAWLSRSDFGGNSQSSLNDPYRRERHLDFDEPVYADYDVFGLKLGYEFEHFSLTSTSGYVSYISEERVGAIYLPPEAYLKTHLESDVFSQEVVLNSTSAGKWRWTAGAMYRDGEDRLLQDTPPNNVFDFFIDFGQMSQSLAVYGELTRLMANGRLELTAGLRYYTDDVGDRENQLTSGAALPLIKRDDTFDQLTPRVVLTWHASDALVVYGSYSEGFRSGFNQWALITRVAPEFPSVEPDIISNYEIGAKGTLWGDRVSFDVATYFINWEDKIDGVLVDYNGIPISTLLNSTGASGMGVELGITANIAAGFRVGGTISWNDLGFDGDKFSGNTLVFAKGDRLGGAPEYTGGLWASYAFPIGRAGYVGEFSASANYTSELGARTRIAGTVQENIGDPMLSSHASFSVATPNKWVATLYVDNLSNENGLVHPLNAFVPDGQNRVRPRTIGLMFDFKY